MGVAKSASDLHKSSRQQSGQLAKPAPAAPLLELRNQNTTTNNDPNGGGPPNANDINEQQ